MAVAKEVEKFIIEKIVMPDGQEDTELIHRLYDFGFHPGLEVHVVAKVSFNSVTVVEFGSTRMALNTEEFACLRGH